MEPLTLSYVDDDIVRLTLQNGRGNPISMSLLDSLHGHLDTLFEKPPRAVVFDADGSRVFCGGVDLNSMIDADRETVTLFFRRLGKVIYRFLELPSVTVAAISGHAIAGGFILALAFDTRIVGESGLKFGLSEADLGLALPPNAVELLKMRLGAPAALRLSTYGNLFGSEEARQLGFADERAADPEARAQMVARALADKPGQGVLLTRMFCHTGLIHQMRQADERYFDAFIDTWFSDDAQARLRALADKLKKRS
ncbi:MAG: enoyl-CoA hydratase/isomerase family protein [Myxococcota bacterium]